MLGARNEERLPVYRRMDLHLSRRFRIHDTELRAFVDVMNLFDTDNTMPGYELLELEGGSFEAEIDEVVGLPRYFRIGVSWRF